MSEPTNDLSNDLDVIARMRAALDEVAAGIGTDDGLVPLRGDAPAHRRWLGIAAASVLLAGGAGFALSRRASDDPVAAPDQPTTTVAQPNPTVAPEGTAPWFQIDTPGLIGGDIVTTPAAPLDEQALFQSWKYDSGDAVGFVTAMIQPERGDPGAEGGVIEELAVDDGTAQLVVPPGSDPNLEHWLMVRWFRSDGSVWVFRGQGMDRPAFIHLVRPAVPGSGLPIVLPDPAAAPWLVGTIGVETTSQQYGTGTAIVNLSMQRDGSGFQRLIGAANIGEVTVAGHPGYSALADDNSVEVVWDAGGGWWGSLSISPDLARGADGIIAAVVPAIEP